jgi:dGTPase
VTPQGYGPASGHRYADEPGDDVTRTPPDDPRRRFADDHARVLRSVALRALGGKTQTLDVGEDHTPRNRLTHSLEVAQIARDIGQALGAEPFLLETAGLVHDLGHPPFGHNGETALNEIAMEAGGFEANAQTLRVLTRLEPGPSTARGLNLTRAVLDASCKYPWTRQDGTRKFGVYTDDTPVFRWMRVGSPNLHPCMEAQITDWADDVANAVSDLEDAIRAYRISPTLMGSHAERASIAQLAAERMTSEPTSLIEAVAGDLVRLPPAAWLLRHGYDGTPTALTAAKHLTGHLLGRFVGAAVTETQRVQGAGFLTRHHADLIVPPKTRAEVAWLTALTLRHVLHAPDCRRKRHRQRTMIAELFDAVLRGAPRTLDPTLTRMWVAAATDTDHVRIVTDHLALLTESQVLAQHRQLRRRATRTTRGSSSPRTPTRAR